MLEIESLTKRFDTVTAVNGLSLTVRPGEVLGFLGPNGAGKTTTMKMVTGYLAPDGGRARRRPPPARSSCWATTARRWSSCGHGRAPGSTQRRRRCRASCRR